MSLEYTDANAEHVLAEAERRCAQDVSGAWEVVTSPTPPPPTTPEEEEQGDDVKPEVGQKLPPEAVPDDDGKDVRQSRLKRRTIGAGAKAEGTSGASSSVSVLAGEAGAIVVVSAGPSQRPKWSARTAGGEWGRRCANGRGSQRGRRG
ncbi:hypothetical protein WOLCODRAFT_18303 [Wolfiporia cocos MD-104 SS10]|uniref:Uncharacterized protein n=1 Tax=Wolfiporia cocos (strain MD-104) TaxID=742152 RepID=A0A2H3JTS3_WOLCO|nr:hypothetical protein WOLCODRAFT_18303 [Wolfiporia cocos MD-104 SS10]